MPLWIPITIAAAFLQNLRSTWQKQLTGDLSAIAATYVRFSFGLPIAGVYLWGLWAIGGIALPSPNGLFVLYAVIGALYGAQGAPRAPLNSPERAAYNPRKQPKNRVFHSVETFFPLCGKNGESFSIVWKNR